jgi:hypothetical protein
VYITGDTELINGVDNTVTIEIDAPDGTVKTYTVIVHLNGDTTIDSIQINGEDVSPGDVFSVPFGTKDFELLVFPTDFSTQVTYTSKVLVTGNNVIPISLRARDGLTQTYSVTIRVNNDTSLKLFKVGTTVVRDGTRIVLPYGTKKVTVTATARDSKSKVRITGGSNLLTGDNLLIVRVTGLDSSFTEYLVTINVKALSSDNSLTSLKINNRETRSGEVINLPKGVTSVKITTAVSEAKAKVAITGGAKLKPGNNTVLVKVTAENGQVATNTITLVVATNNDPWLNISTDPNQAFGTVSATDGETTTTATFASTKTKMTVKGVGWLLSWTPYWLTKKAVALDASKNLVTTAGASAALSATGFMAKSEVRVYLGTALVGTLISGSTGAVAGSIVIPSTLSPGQYSLTVKGFSSVYTARSISVGMAVKLGYVTTEFVVSFAEPGVIVTPEASATLTSIANLVKGSGSTLIDIKSWVAGSVATTAIKKLGTSRATAIKTALTKLKVAATYTAIFGSLETLGSSSARTVITVRHAMP